MKILLADDDDSLVDLVSYALHRQGHRVITAFHGEQALQRSLGEEPDLVLLDVAMPQMDGLDVCRRIREHSPVPIIMLSGHTEEVDLVRGYESGADDYIAKPFSARQLLLRIDTLMRRVNKVQREPGGREARGATLGDLSIDPAAFEVRKNGTRIILTRLEFRMLHLLVQCAGTLVEADRIADYAWDSATGGDVALLKTHISHIRQKLMEAGGDPLRIRAIPRTGYILSFEGDETAAGEAITAEAV